MTGDRSDLERFVVAQDAGGTYEQAVRELRAGCKTSHWMWFVFPQLRGLGHSPNADFYGIAGLGEARAYLAHPVLGPRLLECTGVVAATEGRTAVQIFGSIDAMKLRSSMTLFARAADDPAPFVDVLTRFFAGTADERTDRLLSGG